MSIEISIFIFGGHWQGLIWVASYASMGSHIHEDDH
jgi:hypothetical protein